MPMMTDATPRTMMEILSRSKETAASEKSPPNRIEAPIQKISETLRKDS